MDVLRGLLLLAGTAGFLVALVLIAAGIPKARLRLRKWGLITLSASVVGCVVGVTTVPSQPEAGTPYRPSVGPFGVEMGQPVEGKDGTDDDGISFDLLKPPAGFGAMAVYGSETAGACAIRLVKEVKDDGYGRAMRSAMADLKDLLTEKYGTSTDYEDDIGWLAKWQEPDEWMKALRDGERVLASSWGDFDPTAHEGVKVIVLMAKAHSSNAGTLQLSYTFWNIDDCKKEARAKRLDLF